jgi:hypothetical protein
MKTGKQRIRSQQGFASKALIATGADRGMNGHSSSGLPVCPCANAGILPLVGEKLLATRGNC